MRRALTIALTLSLGACAGGGGEAPAEDRVRQKCREYLGALCRTYAECEAEGASGVTITNAVCEDTLPGLVADCTEESRADIEATSDADFDACTQALAALPCNALCNRVPADPPECLALPSYEPASSIVSCAP